MSNKNIVLLLLMMVFIGFVSQPVYAVPDDFKENDTYWINQELDIFTDSKTYDKDDLEKFKDNNLNNTSINESLNESLNSTDLNKSQIDKITNNTSITINNEDTSLLVTEYVVNNNSKLVFDLRDYKNNEYNILFKNNNSDINFTYNNNTINIDTKGDGIISNILNIL